MNIKLLFVEHAICNTKLHLNVRFKITFKIS